MLLFKHAVCLSEISQKANNALKICRLKENVQEKRTATVESIVKLLIIFWRPNLTLL